MIFPLMAEKTRYLKENPKGVREVCKQMEDLRNASIQEGILIGEKRGMEKGMEKGMKKGMEKGRIIMLVELIKDGSLKIEKAAIKAGMTVEQLQKAMEEIAN